METKAMAPSAASPAVLRKMLSLGDFEHEARRRLPRPIFGYVAGAAEENASLDDNRAAFRELGFVTRVLRNVSGRSQHVELFGQRYASPFGIAPMGITALSSYRGDVVLARAAASQGVVSIMSATSLSNVPAAGSRPTCRATRRASTRWSTGWPLPVSRPWW
jgi:L-lactate dehydrogenase (cytochrome)